MSRLTTDVAFSSSVKAEQERLGSRAQYLRLEQGHGWPDRITPELAHQIARTRSFYFGTASAAGQPYIQHRGGPAGFLTVIDDSTLGFADYRGNRQYITLGNLAENPRAFIFLMSYAERRRIKLWGTAQVVEGDAAVLARLRGADGEVPQRAILFRIAAWDRNCPQHIPVLLPAEEVEATFAELRQQIRSLEDEVARLNGESVRR